MLNYIIPLISKMSPMWGYVLDFVVALCFVATVPCILRRVVKG